MSFERHPEATARFQFGTPLVITPGATVWTSNFNSWPSALTASLFRYWSDTGRDNGPGAEWETNAAVTTTVGSLSGLTVGRQYRFSLFIKINTGTPTFRMAVAGVTSTLTAVTTSYVQRTVTFTADSTSYPLSFIAGAAAKYYIDDLALELLPITSSSVSLPVSEGDLTLDKSHAPFGTADLTVPLMSTQVLESLSPFTNPRVQLTAAAENDPRVFDLVMTGRTVDHSARVVKMDLATDEALLQAYSKLTDDQGAFSRQDSLRSIINYVLGQAIPGAALQTTGAADRPFRVLTDATNMLIDPRYARTPNGGYGAANVTTLVDNTWVNSENLWGVHLYAPASTDGFFELRNADMAYGMQAGRSYTFSATGSVRSAMGGTERVERARRLVVVALLPSGYVDLATSPQVSTTVNADTRVSVSFTVPANATQVWVRAYHGHTQGTITWRAFRLTETDRYAGTHNSEYFDGVRPNTTDYAYSWTGAADNSPSRRVALFSRAPEVLSWRAGRSAWDFLAGIIDVAGLRLWCDEQRRWWLVDPKDYKVPGRVSVRVDNATDGNDTMDAGGGDAPTGVVARFTWRDNDGNSKTKDDYAGTPGRVMVMEFDDRPYPGPGTAALVLVGMTNRGRTQEVTVASVMSATPGQEISISLPGTNDQLGQLQSVRWDLTEGLMDLRSAGLTEVTPGSWLQGYSERTWPNAPDTDTWASLT